MSLTTPDASVFRRITIRRELSVLFWCGLLIFAAMLSMPLWKIYETQNAVYIDGIQSTYLSRWQGLMVTLGDKLIAKAPTPEESDITGLLNSALLNEFTRRSPQVTGLIKLSSAQSTSTVWLVTARTQSPTTYQAAITSLSTYINVIRDQLGTDFFILDNQGHLLATNNQVQWQAIQPLIIASPAVVQSQISLLSEDWVRIPLQGLGGEMLATLYVRHVSSIQAQLATNLWVITVALLVTLVLVLGTVGQGLIYRIFQPMDQLGADLTALAKGDWFLDLHRPNQNNEVSQMQKSLLVFQQQNIDLAKQSFEHNLSILRERTLLETELQSIAQLLPAQEQEDLHRLLNDKTDREPSLQRSSALALGFQMVSAKVIDQQTKVNELLTQRTADLALIQQALLERTQLDRLREELALANKLQMANLPQPEAAKALRPTLDLFATMRSAREVGGDFYDFFQITPDQVVLMVGDASGKGIAAGMLVLVARTLLRAHLMAGSDLAQCLCDCNRLLSQDNPGGSFTTVFLAMLNLRTGVLTFSNAGHNPPLIRKSAGGIHGLTQANGVMLGIMDEWTYTTHQIQLINGDCLLLYSDGVSEAQNAAHDLFGQARLEQTFSQPCGDAQTEVSQLLQRVDEFAAEAEQFDDITILAMRYHPEN